MKRGSEQQIKKNYFDSLIIRKGTYKTKVAFITICCWLIGVQAGSHYLFLFRVLRHKFRYLDGQKPIGWNLALGFQHLDLLEGLFIVPIVDFEDLFSRRHCKLGCKTEAKAHFFVP